VILSGSQVWIGAGDRTPKQLQIGDYSYIGHATEFFIGSSVSIGNHVQLANRVVLNGYDGHPLDPLLRARGDGPPASGQAPIRIADYAWLANDVTVLRGVSIGRGAVVASCSVVTRDVPELCVVAGNPARVVKQLPTPVGWR
jgi:acetyltransferase-like isoleucine patch superfamily enzyme